MRQAHLAQCGSCSYSRDNARNNVSQIVSAHETTGQRCPCCPHHDGERHSHVPCMQPHQRKGRQKGHPAQCTRAISRPLTLLPTLTVQQLTHNVSVIASLQDVDALPCKMLIVTWLHAR